MATGLPYDGWYNGDTDMMMQNGTYADFRFIFEKKVELGKMKQSELDALDKKWNAIPVTERMKLRAVVVDESTPKPKEVKTADGIIVIAVAKPSEGNNVKKEREKAKTKRALKLPAGALTNDNNPLVSSAQ